MKKLILILIASIGISFYLSAQSSGDYRSVGSGNWNDATKWEIYDGSNWVTTAIYPGQNTGTAGVFIVSGTVIQITESVLHPVTTLSLDGDPVGVLNFSAETAVSLTVSGDVVIFGGLGIDNQNGAKTHNLFIGGNFGVWKDYLNQDNMEYFSVGWFETINGDDKLNVTFNSTDPIVINGRNDISFQDISFNGAEVIVVIPIYIRGTATFINGIVVGYDYGIFFLDDANVSSASNLSFIDGGVTKIGNDPFTFPIGDEGVYAPLTISAPLSETDDFVAQYKRSSGATLGPISNPELYSISDCEYWTLYPDWGSSYNNFQGPIDVTVGWTSASGCGTSPYIANVSDVTLAIFNGGSWESHSGAGSGSTTNGSVTWTGLINFAALTLGNVSRCGAPSQLLTTNITTNSATVSWSALPGAISYDIDYSANGGNIWINAATATASTSVILSNLLHPGFFYPWRVRSNCGSAPSAYRLSGFTTFDCGSPTALSTTNITSGTATVSWAPVPNAISYNLQYKQSTAGSWIPIVTATNSLSHNLSGLSSSTSYNWRVLASCSQGPGNYAYDGFTTASTPLCMNAYETNNTSQQAKTISLGIIVFAGISSATDVDWFKVNTSNNSNSTLEVTLSNLPADYDLYVYSNGSKLLGSSATAGTPNEVVIYNSNARNATYYIKVLGKNGAFNTSQCYSLLAQVGSSPARSVSNASTPQKEINEGLSKQMLYPNPASEFVYLTFNSATEGVVNIEIVNSIGQLVKQHPVNTIKGHNQFKIQVADIRPGMYILRINKGDLNLTKKFVIAR